MVEAIWIGSKDGLLVLSSLHLHALAEEVQSIHMLPAGYEAGEENWHARSVCALAKELTLHYIDANVVAEPLLGKLEEGAALALHQQT